MTLGGNIPTPTNCTIFRQIVDESYIAMKKSTEEHRRPNPTSDVGSIITVDPSHAGLKSALNVIVFAGIWLEAYLHLVAVSRLGKGAAKKFDRKAYEDKLTQLECSNSDILDKAKRLRNTRREIVHEKAHFDSGEIKIAQTEAQLAYELVTSVETEITLRPKS